MGWFKTGLDFPAAQLGNQLVAVKVLTGIPQ